MNSTLSELITLLGNQLDYDDIDENSDPSSTILTMYLNLANRKIAKFDRPMELDAFERTAYDLTSGVNYVPLNEPSDKYRIKLNADAELTGSWNVGDNVTDSTRTGVITEVGTQYIIINNGSSKVGWTGTITNSDTAATFTLSSFRVITPIIVPTSVYYKNGTNAHKELRNQRSKQMIFKEGASSYFDSNKVKDPDYYYIGKNTITLNTQPKNNISEGLKILGITEPLWLDNLTDLNSLSVDYDLLLVYEAMFLFYQKDDDTENMLKYQGLAQRQRDDLAISQDLNDMENIEMDPYVFTGSVTSINNPGVFFEG